jgi:hypothetical protein
MPARRPSLTVSALSMSCVHTPPAKPYGVSLARLTACRMSSNGTDDSTRGEDLLPGDLLVDLPPDPAGDPGGRHGRRDHRRVRRGV